MIECNRKKTIQYSLLFAFLSIEWTCLFNYCFVYLLLQQIFLYTHSLELGPNLMKNLFSSVYALTHKI